MKIKFGDLKRVIREVVESSSFNVGDWVAFDDRYGTTVGRVTSLAPYKHDPADSLINIDLGGSSTSFLMKFAAQKGLRHATPQEVEAELAARPGREREASDFYNSLSYKGD